MSQNNDQPVLEQLWYSWSPYGFGYGQGFQVRAASSGLKTMKSTRVVALRNLLGYVRPKGLVTSVTEQNAPICLEFTEISFEKMRDKEIYVEKNRVLVQKVHVDGDAQHQGIYFCHLVANLPGTRTYLKGDPNANLPVSGAYVAKNAIELWRSPFWRVSDAEKKENPHDLDLEQITDMQAIPVGALSAQTLAEWRLTEWLSFILQAFLETQGQSRLFIAAQADVVAALIWGLTHCLPRTLDVMQSLTFSTYESDVSKASNSIVGTWLPVKLLKTPRDLPAFCYAGNNIGVNYETGKVYPDLSDETYSFVYASKVTGWLVAESLEERQKLEDIILDVEEDIVLDVEREHIAEIDGFLEFSRPYITCNGDYPETVDLATYRIERYIHHALRENQSPDAFSPRFVSPAHLYLENLTYRDVRENITYRNVKRPDAQFALRYFGHETFPVPTLRQIARNWYTLWSIINGNTFEVATAETIRELLPQIGAKVTDELKEDLIRAITVIDYNAALFDLGRITYILGTVLAVSRFDLIGRIVLHASERYGQKSSLRWLYPYIRLILEESLHLPPEQAGGFVTMALDNLFSCVQADEKQFAILQTKIENFPKRLKEIWATYVATSRFAQYLVSPPAFQQSSVIPGSDERQEVRVARNNSSRMQGRSPRQVPPSQRNADRENGQLPQRNAPRKQQPMTSKIVKTISQWLSSWNK